jgi:hypothetical protein
MQSERKNFYKLQYRWIRLAHPSTQAAVDSHHPLHAIDLEIAHWDHIVHNLIQDVLGSRKIFTSDDIAKLVMTFSNIRSQLQAMPEAELVNEFEYYVSQTLELLNSASKLLYKE